MHLYLRPSEIRYSQENISNHFFKEGRHGEKLIGETLDDICEGRTTINAIPRISVIQRNGTYMTADNRRLWVFRHLERLGFCTEIQVRLADDIRPEKLTSINGGREVRVRGYPGGVWYQKKTPPGFRPNSAPARSSEYSRSPVITSRSDVSGDFWGGAFQRPQPRVTTSYSQSRVYTPEPPRRQESDSWCTIL